MKKTVIIFFLFYCNIYVCTQDICVKDIIKYKEANNYLIKDSIMDDKSLFVSAPNFSSGVDIAPSKTTGLLVKNSVKLKVSESFLS